MQIALVVVGLMLSILSIPAYYNSPHFLSDAEHKFIGSMSGGNMNTASMLRQMGYPSMHQVIPILQYSLIGVGVAGIGLAMFGIVAKKRPKSVPVKLVADKSLEESPITDSSRRPETMKDIKSDTGNKVMYEAVDDILGKLETELEKMRTSYEDHKLKTENEENKFEQRERKQMAKIIATGEVLKKEVTPDQFGERIKYYVELKNEKTGQPVDLSLLAEKFAKIRKTTEFDDSYITKTEFKTIKKSLGK